MVMFVYIRVYRLLHTHNKCEKKGVISWGHVLRMIPHGAASSSSSLSNSKYIPIRSIFAMRPKGKDIVKPWNPYLELVNNRTEEISLLSKLWIIVNPTSLSLSICICVIRTWMQQYIYIGEIGNIKPHRIFGASLTSIQKATNQLMIR